MPPFPSGIRRVILVVLDGLRADAPARHRMPHLASLLETGAWTLSGRTVRPSVTAAAMTSLFTGVSPEIHGLRSDRFALPRGPVCPLPALLRGQGLATHGFMAQIPLVHRVVAARIAHRLGAATTFRGWSAAEILAAAQRTIARERTGLIVLHWPDADRAGHGAGWHSPLGPASLLDIPATTLWALGVPVPGHFGGRPLAEAFRERAAHPAAA